MLDKETIDLRRRLFWIAYCMDRTISPALQRPLYIPDGIINAAFPDSSRPSMDEPTPPPKEQAICWMKYCRIQSAVIEVHFQQKPLERDWDRWLAESERALGNWYRDNYSTDDAIQFAYAHGLVRLHRPSPRMPKPSAASLTTAFDAACKSAKHNREPIVGGLLRKPWLAAHHTAESAMVAIFALRHAYDEIRGKYSASEIFDKTKIFTSNLLTLAAHGWPEISNFAATFERLLGPLITGVLTKTPSASLLYPPVLDAELNKFLLPGPTDSETYFGVGFSTNILDSGTNMADIMLPQSWDDAFLEALACSTDDYHWGDISFGEPEVVDDFLMSLS
jgi:hypothetical protein